MFEREIQHPSGQVYRVRLALESDVPVVRTLVNKAYQELADAGLNYTASYQDEAVTRQRMSLGRTFLICTSNEVVGTIHLREEKISPRQNCAYIGQFGILPSHKRQRLGTLVMDFIEDLARNEGFPFVRLDTAKPALHLVHFYQSRGYQIVGETRFEGKTYESWIFEKDLTALHTPISRPEFVTPQILN